MAPNEELCFGSEIKQFIVHPSWQAKLNGQRAYDYLAWGITSHTDETLFRDVFSLKPGHSTLIDVNHINVKQGKVEQTQWYQLVARSFNGTFQEAKRQFKQQFQQAVSLRLRADVPVGSCLSGGLDSSSVVGVVADLRDDMEMQTIQKTFSICSHDKALDERKWIDMVVEKTGVEAHYAYPDLEQVFDKSDRIIWHQEVPYAAAGVCMQWEVMTLAAQQQMKVLLDGQGSDEYLAGYPSFFGPFHVRLFMSGHLMAWLQELSFARRIHGRTYRTSLTGMMNSMLPHKVKASLQKNTSRPNWLNLEKLGAQSVNPYLEAGVQSKNIAELSQMLLARTNIPLLLHWEDRNSMAHSIESRVPFLDHNLVETVLGFPDTYKIHHGVTKYVLREALSQYLPQQVAKRHDKKGFIAPEEVWLKKHDGHLFREKLLNAISLCEGILNKKESMAIFENIVSGKVTFNQLPWRMVNFAQWMQIFAVQ